MKTEVTELRTEAVYSDDGEKRYLLRKTWDESKPKLAIVMLAAGGADGIQLDTTTQLVVNNSARLGYGSVAIVNLSATLNDFNLHDTDEDPDNIKVILDVAKDVEAVVYAPGTGKAKNKSFLLLRNVCYAPYCLTRISCTACATNTAMGGYSIPCLRKSECGAFLP